MKINIMKIFSIIFILLSVNLVVTNAAVALPSNTNIKWICDDGVWKAYDFEGNICYDTWVNDNGEWYYINYKAAMMHNSWYKIKGAWYYFDSNGRMAHDCYIDNYYVNSSGEWIK